MVDGLEREFEGRALVVRVNFQTDAGRALGRRYDVDAVPSFVVFDGSGEVIFKRKGARGVPLEDLRRALET